MNKVKTLCKSTKNKKICGVCGGIAEYFDMDATIVRLIFAFLFFCGSLGLWPYLICALILPKDTEVKKENINNNIPEPVLPPEPEAPEAVKKRCDICGSVINNDAEYCSICGSHQTLNKE